MALEPDITPAAVLSSAFVPEAPPVQPSTEAMQAALKAHDVAQGRMYFAEKLQGLSIL